jgi:hypothetical protein
MARTKIPLIDRLMKFVSPEPNSGCWLWIGSCRPDGYGQIWDGATHMKTAHRVTYEILRGPIPEGLELDHLCRVRCCVNPWHLEPVAHWENLRRAVYTERRGNKWRLRTHCSNGHLYDPSTIYWRSGKWRACRICHRDRDREDRRVRREKAKE